MKKSTWLWLAAVVLWNVTSTLNAGKGWSAVPGALILPLMILGAIGLLKTKGNRFAPLVRNATTKALTKKRYRTFWFGLICAIALIAVDWIVVHLILLGAFALYAAYAVPALAALAVLVAAMAMGGELILVAAPLTVILARRDRWMRLDIPRSIVHTLTTLVVAVLAFVFSLAFASMTIGGRSAAADGARPASGTGPIATLLRMLGVNTSGTGANPSRPVQVPSTPAAPPEPPRDFSVPWLWLLALALIAAVIAAVVIWRRRRTPKTPAIISARPLARLEAIGKAIGRPRRSNEGALSYAAALSDRSGDERLPETGDLVSGRLYASVSTDPASVEAQLGQLEATPPVVPKVPLGDRIRRAAQWPVDHWRGVALTLGGVGALVVGVFAIAPQVNSFDDAPDLLAFNADGSGFFDAQSTPDEWFNLMGREPSELTQWESCSSDVAAPDHSIGRRASGLATLDGSLALQAQGYGVESDLIVTFGTPTSFWQLLDPADTVIAEPEAAQWRQSDWGAVPQNPFPSLTDVLVQTQPNDPLVSTEIDRFGRRYLRHESQPLTYGADEDALYVPAPFIASSYEYAWTLDVWLDELDVPVRVRSMIDNPDRTWQEWRRLPALTGNAVAGPACPVISADSAPESSDWVGAEAWQPSRAVPVRIESTERGFLYESDPWYDENDALPELATIGSIPGPLSRIGLDDYLPLYNPEVLGEDTEATGSVDDRVVALVNWPDGASVSLVSFSFGPEATRLDRAGGVRVAEWAEPQPFDVWESFLTVTTESGLGSMATEDISELINPLWDGADIVSTDRSGDGDDDTYLVTQSWAESVMYGYDDHGDLVSIAVLGELARWRTLGFEGKPPASIGNRESELQACLDGDRPVDAAGYCQ